MHNQFNQLPVGLKNSSCSLSTKACLFVLTSVYPVDSTVIRHLHFHLRVQFDTTPFSPYKNRRTRNATKRKMLVGVISLHLVVFLFLIPIGNGGGVSHSIMPSLRQRIWYFIVLDSSCAARSVPGSVASNGEATCAYASESRCDFHLQDTRGWHPELDSHWLAAVSWLMSVTPELVAFPQPWPRSIPASVRTPCRSTRVCS